MVWEILLNTSRVLRELESTWWRWGLFVVVVIVSIGVILRIKGWFHEDDDPANGDQQMLSEIAELQRRGELSGEEYRSIKGRLVNRIKASHSGTEPQEKLARKSEQEDST